jgi:hypothetical protein
MEETMPADLSSIHEETFPATDEHELAQVCKERFIIWDPHKSMIHAVYSKVYGLELIYGYAFTGTQADVARNFKEELDHLLRVVKRPSIWDFAFLIDLFCSVRPEPKIDIIDKAFEDREECNMDETAEHILEQSYGYLLWDFQLINLCNLFCDNTCTGREKSRKIRDGLNKRDAEIEDYCKTLRLRHGLTLFEFFQERAVATFTGEPSLKQAKNLLDVLVHERVI